MSAKFPIRRDFDRAAPAADAPSPHARILRAAGLTVTTARLAALRLAPEVLREHGSLTPGNLHAAACRHGYVVSPTAFRGVLRRLREAGLLPPPILPSCSDDWD